MNYIEITMKMLEIFYVVFLVILGAFFFILFYALLWKLGEKIAKYLKLGVFDD